MASLATINVMAKSKMKRWGWNGRESTLGGTPLIHSKAPIIATCHHYQENIPGSALAIKKGRINIWTRIAMIENLNTSLSALALPAQHKTIKRSDIQMKTFLNNLTSSSIDQSGYHY